MTSLTYDTALVTGGAGFIGSHLVDELVRRGVTTLVVDNLSTGKVANLSKSWNQIRFINADLRFHTKLKEILADVDIVLHLAANASVPNSVKNPRYDFKTNTLGTFNLLEACLDSQVKKVVLASSAAVYGEPRYLPIDEEHPLDPLSPYGGSKLAAENILMAFARTYGIEAAGLRIFNTYGPRQNRYVMYDFFEKLSKDSSKLEVLGDGEQVRDYCYVDDTVAAFTLVARKGRGFYNVGRGVPTSIRKVAELMTRMVSPKAKILYGGKTWKGDIKTLLADISKIRKIGFSPKITLEAGMKMTIQAFKKSLGSDKK